MLKIYIANNSTQTIGGGWTFLSNFKKGAAGKVQFVADWKLCDIYLIMSCSAADRGEVASAKQAGKKIVLRVDNIPKRSRNKKNPADSLRMFGAMADEVVYQSEWAKQYAGWITKRRGVVIYNGVDYEHFYFKDNPKDRPERYLYVSYNTDENKRWPEAAYDFHMRFRDNPEIEIWLVGTFGKQTGELLINDFDFFAGEQYRYIEPVADREALADIMRQCKYFYFPAYNDASPNSLAEAIACGCEPLLINPSGGSQEVYDLFRSRTYSIQTMADKYLAIFNSLT